MSRTTRHIAFVSSNEQWGGSEELWSRAAQALSRDGHEILATKPNFASAAKPRTALVTAGCRTVDLTGAGWWPRLGRKLASAVGPLSRRLRDRRLASALRAHRSELVVVSQGLNYDGWFAAQICRKLAIPYVLISQKSSDLYWPPDSIHERLVDVYRGSLAALFVSEHNRRLTEEQIGLLLPQATVVRNPYNADWAAAPPWPEAEGRIVLGCLARLDAREKGQDILFRVLALPKWRSRPLTVRLYGAGPNEHGLRAMAEMLSLDSVEFCGFVEDPLPLWSTMHGLVLPSRCEGLPLSLIEAMLSERVAIVTDVGGNGEAMVDNVTGFMAASATEAALDEALERAWQRRAEWQVIGRAAGERARTLVGPDPARELADLLVTLAERCACEGGCS